MLRLIGIVLSVATVYAFYRLATADGHQSVAPATQTATNGQVPS